jgi:putative phosphoribosyl transferase
VVDDGLATGGTARAALRAVRARQPRRVVLAVPVGAPRAVAALRGQADDIVCILQPERLRAVGAWYEDFTAIPDDEVVALLDGDDPDPASPPCRPREVRVPVACVTGDLALPEPCAGLVIFAHGSGSSRHSPRNRRVAAALNERGLATLLLDLLTEEEEVDRTNVFDIDLLSRRLVAATRWSLDQRELRDQPIGYFGASTGAAAALTAAADLGGHVAAVVSRGGRPDLAAPRLAEVLAPVLLIVGGNDDLVLELNREAQAMLLAPSEVAVVPGATHLFEEPGALDEVARLAGTWFGRHLAGAAVPA